MKIQVPANQKETKTNIYFAKGDIVYFNVSGFWKDLTIVCDGDGWTGSSVFPLAPWVYDNQIINNQKVCPNFPFLRLMGKIGETVFSIGNGKKQIMTQDEGELILFPNDVWWLYWNNAGSLTVEID